MTKEDVLPVLSLIGLILVLVSPVFGKPPAGATDPALQQFYQSLTMPGTGVSCCSISDCRPAKEQKIDPKTGHYMVLLTPDRFMVDKPMWVEVPPDKIIQGKHNPTGEPVVCWLPAQGVMCYVRGLEI